MERDLISKKLNRAYNIGATTPGPAAVISSAESHPYNDSIPPVTLSAMERNLGRDYKSPRKAGPKTASAAVVPTQEIIADRTALVMSEECRKKTKCGRNTAAVTPGVVAISDDSKEEEEDAKAAASNDNDGLTSPADMDELSDALSPRICIGAIRVTPNSDLLVGNSMTSFEYGDRVRGSLTTVNHAVSVAPDVVQGSTLHYASGSSQGLAVAVAVSQDNDNDDGIVRVHGTEYDPDSKRAIYKNSRVRLYGLVACLVLLAIIGGTLGGVLAPSRSSKSPLLPTSAPTSSREGQYYRLFANAVGNDMVLRDGTPHRLAADWIIDADPMRLPVENDHLLQRYLLALLYFQMSQNGKSPWRSCNPPNEGQNDTCEYFNLDNGSLTFFSNGTWSASFSPEDVNPKTNGSYYRWLSGAHECDWVGNSCDDEHVLFGMDLSFQNMVGTLPTELVTVSSLQLFSASLNLIEGSIPPEYTNFSSLVVLALDGNLLTGSFPEVWAQSTGLLVYLNLGNNMLSGSLTSHLGLLTNLEGLFLYYNQLNGIIPKEIGQVRKLTNIRLNNNRFDALPTDIGDLASVTEFWLHQNNLVGTIPSEIGMMTNLTDLSLNDNKLSGTIPEDLFGLTSSIRYLNLSNLKLNGTLSARIGNLTNLQYLYLNQNHLTGSIPTELASLTNLLQAFLFFNDFNGSIPNQICANRGSVTNNDLQSLQADCGPRSDPAQPCSCCTACCDRESKACLKVSN